MKPTTPEDRAAIIAEVQECTLGTAQEWLRHWQPDADEGILHGADLRLRYYEDGTVVAEIDDEPVLTMRFTLAVEVVAHTEAINEPVGGVLDRTWATVPSGWFVQTPKGAWIEVGETVLRGGVQHVALIVNGQAAVFPRDPIDMVKARRGSLSSTVMDDATSALESAFQTAILRDEPPGQS